MRAHRSRAFVTPLDHCPYCSEVLEAATPVSGEAGPSPGDITVCLYCGGMLEFEEGLSVVKSATALSELDKQTRSEVMAIKAKVAERKPG